MLAVAVRPCDADLLPEIAPPAFGSRIDLVAGEFPCRGHDTLCRRAELEALLVVALRPPAKGSAQILIR